MLFHFSTASLLPLVSENLAPSKIANSALFMAGLIVIPQLVVAILAPWIGYWSELWGRKPLLLAGFAVEAARAVLFTLVSDPLLMMAVQLLDGVSNAVIIVLTILVVLSLLAGNQAREIRRLMCRNRRSGWPLASFGDVSRQA